MYILNWSWINMYCKVLSSYNKNKQSKLFYMGLSVIFLKHSMNKDFFQKNTQRKTEKEGL